MVTGYLAGPVAGGAVAELLGFGALGLIPLAAALLLAVPAGVRDGVGADVRPVL